MESLRTVISFLAYFALVFTVAEVYLTLNKLWKRKHEKVVAESISIMGKLSGLIPLGIFSVNYLLVAQWQGFVDASLWFFATLLQIFIGLGFWVEGQRRRGFFSLMRGNIKDERGEVTELARSIFRPSGAEKIMQILKEIALIDKHLDEKEKDFIDTFADSWDIEFSWEGVVEELAKVAEVDYLRIRQHTADYLATSPPENQVSQFSDIVNMLINIDEEVSPEEEQVLEELTGMIKEYLHEDGDFSHFHVTVVPQNREQEEAIPTLLPDLQGRQMAGGFAYLAGPFYSQRYAEIMCNQFRALNFFSVYVDSSELQLET